jgi:hypothetical protein
LSEDDEEQLFRLQFHAIPLKASIQPFVEKNEIKCLLKLEWLIAGLILFVDDEPIGDSLVAQLQGYIIKKATFAALSL